MAETFRELIAANKRNSLLLVIGFCIFTTLVVSILSIGLALYFDPSIIQNQDWTIPIVLVIMTLTLTIVFAIGGYYEGASVVLGISGAKEIQHADDPELFNVVEEMAIAAGVPMPKVYLIYDPALNAFATGRDPQHAAVAITTGLRSQLTRDELQGVIAHEMAHVRNYDIRLMLLLAVLIGTIVILCDMFLRIMRFSALTGGSRRSRSSNDQGNKGGGAIVIVLIILGLVLAIIAPLLAQIIQMAVSRQREYLADATAVELTRYPQGLANALRKLADHNQPMKNATRGTAHLFIVNPIKKFANRGHSMFASHPPLQQRIERLEALVRIPDEKAV